MYRAPMRSPGWAGTVPASLRQVETLRPPSRLGLMALGLCHHTQAPPSSDPANPWLRVLPPAGTSWWVPGDAWGRLSQKFPALSAA